MFFIRPAIRNMRDAEPEDHFRVRGVVYCHAYDSLCVRFPFGCPEATLEGAQSRAVKGACALCPLLGGAYMEAPKLYNMLR